jgi:hypothetical protein
MGLFAMHHLTPSVKLLPKKIKILFYQSCEALFRNIPRIKKKLGYITLRVITSNHLMLLELLNLSQV